MSYVYWVSAASTNPALSDELATAMAVEPGDIAAFSNGTKLYPSDTVFQPRAPGQPVQASKEHVARFVGIALTARGYALVTEFSGAGPYPILNSRGLTDQRIADIKAVTVFEHGDRDVYEPRYAEFIASLNYVRAP